MRLTGRAGGFGKNGARVCPEFNAEAKLGWGRVNRIGLGCAPGNFGCRSNAADVLLTLAWSICLNSRTIQLHHLVGLSNSELTTNRCIVDWGCRRSIRKETIHQLCWKRINSSFKFISNRVVWRHRNRLIGILGRPFRIIIYESLRGSICSDWSIISSNIIRGNRLCRKISDWYIISRIISRWSNPSRICSHGSNPWITI